MVGRRLRRISIADDLTNPRVTSVLIPQLALPGLPMIPFGLEEHGFRLQPIIVLPSGTTMDQITIDIPRGGMSVLIRYQFPQWLLDPRLGMIEEGHVTNENARYLADAEAARMLREVAALANGFQGVVNAQTPAFNLYTLRTPIRIQQRMEQPAQIFALPHPDQGNFPHQNIYYMRLYLCSIPTNYDQAGVSSNIRQLTIPGSPPLTHRPPPPPPAQHQPNTNVRFDSTGSTQQHHPTQGSFSTCK